MVKPGNCPWQLQLSSYFWSWTNPTYVATVPQRHRRRHRRTDDLRYCYSNTALQRIVHRAVKTIEYNRKSSDAWKVLYSKHDMVQNCCSRSLLLIITLTTMIQWDKMQVSTPISLHAASRVAVAGWCDRWNVWIEKWRQNTCQAPVCLSVCLCVCVCVCVSVRHLSVQLVHVVIELFTKRHKSHCRRHCQRRRRRRRIRHLNQPWW